MDPKLARVMALKSPSFMGLRPASGKASLAARKTSRKSGTRCEVTLRRELWSRGLRYRVNFSDLPGTPDIVFVRQRVVVFCDGDFWHGRNLEERLGRLARGHNADYWVAKVLRNAERDRQITFALSVRQWSVLRFWESDILRSPTQIADTVCSRLNTANFQRVVFTHLS
jgi:DNA mismatch endonuclease, patch repair protein